MGEQGYDSGAGESRGQAKPVEGELRGGFEHQGRSAGAGEAYQRCER